MIDLIALKERYSNKPTFNTGTDQGNRVDVPAYLSHNGIQVKNIKTNGTSTLYILETCIFDSNHSGGESAIGQAIDGKLFYQCFHDSCKGRTWKEARQIISGNDSLSPFMGGYEKTRAIEATTEEKEDKPQTNLVDPLDFPDIMAGAAGEFARVLSSNLEPPGQFFYMAYLACLGNIAAGKLVLNSEIQTEPRLYLLILGESADDRKSTALSKTISFFKSATEDFPVCHGVGSAEGLQKILVESDKLLLCLDEFRAFTSKCKIESSVLMPAVTTLFESKYYESHTSKKSIVIQNASLSILAASTVDTYEQIFDEHFLAIGFPNRIFLCPGKGGRRFSLPVRIPEHDWRNLKQGLADILMHIKDLGPIDITYDARKIYHEWYMNLPQSVHAKRLETYAMRLMPLLAVNELKEAVDEEIITKVIQLMDWQYRVRRRYDPIDADNVMARTEEKIRRTLENGPKTRRELSRAVHAHRIGTWFFDTALGNLQKAAHVSTEDKGKTFRLLENETVTTTVTNAGGRNNEG